MYLFQYAYRYHGPHRRAVFIAYNIRRSFGSLGEHFCFSVTPTLETNRRTSIAVFITSLIYGGFFFSFFVNAFHSSTCSENYVLWLILLLIFNLKTIFSRQLVARNPICNMLIIELVLFSFGDPRNWTTQCVYLWSWAYDSGFQSTSFRLIIRIFF